MLFINLFVFLEIWVNMVKLFKLFDLWCGIKNIYINCIMYMYLNCNKYWLVIFIYIINIDYSLLLYIMNIDDI